MKKTKKKRTISAKTRTGITKLQALKQMKKAYWIFRQEVAKILNDNDLFYCIDTDIKNRISSKNRCVNDMVFSLANTGSLANCMIMCDLKTREEAKEFGYA